jgi:hypothetical protein
MSADDLLALLAGDRQRIPSLQRAIVRRTCDFLTSAPALSWARVAANGNAATDQKDG